MIKIMFVCHGNICRSPMAEFVFKDIAEKNGVSDKFLIDSSATSTEEIGNPVYPPAVSELKRHNIKLYPHYAKQITKSDYDKFDLIICMEKYNIRNLTRVIGDDKDNKVHLLMEYAGISRDVADPWYTRNFESAYNDIVTGCTALFNSLKEKL